VDTFYTSSNTVREIRHVIKLEGERNAYEIKLKILMSADHFRELGTNGMMVMIQ